MWSRLLEILGAPSPTAYQQMVEKNVRLEAENAALQERIAVLEERLRAFSGNSSKPPSSDPPAAPPKPAKPPSGRKRGGQQGHPGHFRALIPVAECAVSEDYFPERCARCQAALTGRDPAPERRQVVEIPPVSAWTEEHRLHTLTCGKYGAQTKASLPAHVSPSCFGPRLTGTVAVLAGQFRLSVGLIQSALDTLCGVTLSEGSVIALREEVSAAVAAPVREAVEEARGQAIAHADETGWRQGNADGKNPARTKAWLWALVTRNLIVFQIHLSRGQDAAKALLGQGFAGPLCADRWNGYNWLDWASRQLCWAHLKREFEKIAERGGDSEPLGVRLLELTAQMFGLWHQVKSGLLTREAFAQEVRPIRAAVKGCLEEGQAWGATAKKKSLTAMTARTCKDLLKREAALWMFAATPGLEPTNNVAERAVRQAVIWRKTSLGSQSEAGSVFVARRLSVVMSLRAQQRNVLEFLVEAVEANRSGGVPPSLIPAVAPHQFAQAA